MRKHDSITALVYILTFVAATGISSAQIWVKTTLDAVPPAGLTRDLTGCTRRWLPANGDGNAKCFWNSTNTDFLTANDFVTTPGTVSNTAEIVADLSGPVRLAASTAVVGTTSSTAQANDSAERNLNLLRANGGNLALSGVYPLYIAGPDKLRFGGDVLTRAAANVSALGGTNDANVSSIDFDKLNANTEISLETRTRLLSDNKVFAFFAYTRTGGIIATKVFRQTIGSAHSVFAIGEAGLSARVGQYFTVGMTWAWYSDPRIPRSAGAFHVAFAK